MDDQQTDAVADPHAECATKLADLEAKYKRALADYQNREKDISREREEFAKFCTVDVIRNFLPIVDAVEAAGRPHPPTPPLPEGGGEIGKGFSPSHREQPSPSFRGGARGGAGEREGVGAIYRLCTDFLTQHGVERIGAIGDRVDYLLHEVVGTRPSDEKTVPGTVLEVVQIGYTMHGKLLRPAKVVIT